MVRKLGGSLLVFVALVALASIVCQAQSKAFLSSHVPGPVLNGEAKLVGQLPATQTLHFDIVLAMRHRAALEKFLREVYDPASPVYRHFVTPREFTARFGPSQNDYDSLIAFAKASGFSVTGGSRDSMDVQFTASVASIEQAFHVSIGLYEDATQNRTFFSLDREPTVDLPMQLWHVSGLDNYLIPKRALVRRDPKLDGNVAQATTGSCPGQSFCGSDMRAAYYGGTALTGAGQNIGLFEELGFDIQDVNTYYQGAGQTYTFNVVGVSTDGSSVNCFANQGCDDTEQTLDITQAGGMAPGVNNIFVFVGSSGTAILSGMTTYSPLPLALGCSWYDFGNANSDDPYFEKMAAQGQSFFVAAGDSGGYTRQSPWPENSQYIIGVGGTSLTTTGPGGAWASETYWSAGGVAYGGGGWGTSVDLQSWQLDAATVCASEGGECSTTYRDVPDVAANSQFSFYVCADQSGLSGCTENEYGGTSFAAPMWAGYTALANEQAAAHNDPPAGFFAPYIYALSESDNNVNFHDITNNGGASTFPCVAGYNMCAGWGSPNGAAVINALAPTSADFTLSANPSTVSVTQGSQGTTTVTITPQDGFTGSVTFSALNLPSGVTAAFSPNPTNTSSTLTLTVSNSTTPGNYQVTIQGTSGGLTNTTLLELTVNQLVQSFSLSASPSSVTIARGGATGTSTITVTPTNGFDSNVTFTTSALPKGVTANFNPNPAFPTSVVSFTASKTAKEGTSTITITGTSGSLKATTTITLTVNALGSFTLTASPSSLSIAQGSSGTSTITVVATGGFDQAVTLSATGAPSGVTATFNPNPTTSTSTLTLTVGAGAATGKSTITITGSSGTLTKKTKVKLTVTP
ncbi:MAG: S53 family serine peptidase [Terriglobales bacterium]